MKLNTYRKYYEFLPHECPCDLHFVEWLMENKIGNKNIFHFGTGGHHYVGIENGNFTYPNEIMGITAQKEEYISYIDMVTENAHLNTHYKVLFSDIYTLNERVIPNFDIVTLFHLCEYYYDDKSDYCTLNDETLLRLFINKLNDGGKILFYSKSAKYRLVEPILNSIDNVKVVGDYKTLKIIEKV